MMKVNISLGVLNMPSVLLVLGGVPGTNVIVTVGLICMYAGYNVGQFAVAYPHVYSMEGVGQILGGKWGREGLAFIYAFYMVAISGAGYIAISIGLNAVTDHAACTVAWVAIAAVVNFMFSSIQTLNKVSILGWMGMVSIISSILMVCIAVGVCDSHHGRPALAPPTGDFDLGAVAFPAKSTFLAAMTAVSTPLFSYSGYPMFISIAGEMRKPRLWFRSFFTAHITIIMSYIVTATVVYGYVGTWQTVPALGSAGPVIKKVAWGITLPGLFVSVIIFTHLVAKMIFVRVLRDSEHLNKHSFVHWATWLGIMAGCVSISFILAESIPFFSDFVSLVGSTLANFMAIVLPALMWFHLNGNRRHTEKSLRFRAILAVNLAYLFIGVFVIITGTWGAVLSIKASYAKGAITRPFSCADNS